MNFSIYLNGIKNTIPNDSITIERFLELLKESKTLIQDIRNEENKDERNKLKSKLSYVTFGGTFSKRGNSNLIKSSGYACFDLDDIDNLEEVKEEVIKNKYTHCLFVSPSGKGYKFIVKIPEVKSDEEYKQYWISISKHYSISSNDIATKDISRACYMSYDQEPYFNPGSEVYTDKVELEDSIELNEPKETDESRSAKEYREVCKLIGQGKTKEEVYKEMEAFAKWAGSPDQYKKATYDKAKKFIDSNNEDKPEKDNNKKEEKKNCISSIIDIDNQILVEQVWDEKEGSKFCIYNEEDGSITYAPHYEHYGIIYYPNEGEELEKKAVVLPTKAEEYSSEEDLDKEIINFINKWVDVPVKIANFGLWNTKRSFVYDKFHTLNYSRVQGDTGVGKSRYLDTFGYIHYKPIFTTGATTPAPLFRMMDKWKGTLVMDEADLKRSDEAEDIIKILNQGFEKGKFIMRCDQNDASKIAFFDPFCPKILATRRTFTDKATESRCITHVGSVTERKDIPLNLNKEFFEEAKNIRNKLLMWRFKNFFKIDMDATYDLGDIEPRVKQIVSSYVALFSTNEEAMVEFKEYIKEYQGELIEERKSSFDGAIVGAIHALLERGIIDITAQKIIEQGQFTNKNGKSMTPRSLSSPLKSLGFKKSESKRIDGKVERCVPLDKNHLTKIFERYGYDVTVVTVVMEVSDFNNYEKLSDFTEKVTVETPLPMNRNNRNTVTDKKEIIEQNKDTLDALGNEVPEELRKEIEELSK